MGMTFARFWSLKFQFNFVITLILVGTFCTSLYTNISSTRDFIQNQLESHAQDTATSLGLSISPYMGIDEDKIIVETMISAIFDRGYYYKLALYDVEKRILISKSFDVELEGVPHWFVKMFPINPPVEQTEIDNGWQIAGTLTLQSHPGLAYQQLWTAFSNTLSSHALILVFGLMLAYFLSRQILKPLDAMQNQADKISQRDFVTIDNNSRIPEVKSVVSALNKMVGYIKKSFDELSEYAESMRKRAFEDSLTGLANRRAFIASFSAVLKKLGKNDSGYLFIIRTPSLKVINDTYGHEAADDYLLKAKDIIQKVVKDYKNVIPYRISGSEFCFYLKHTQKDKAELIAKELSELCHNQWQAEMTFGFADIAAVKFDFNNNDLGAILSEGDSALSIANFGGINFYHVYERLDSNDILSYAKWTRVLQKIIRRPNVLLTIQPLETVKDSSLYTHELSSQFIDENGHIYNTQQLMSIAERSGLSFELDKIILRNFLESSKALADKSQVCGVRISTSSLHSEDFRTWLESDFMKNYTGTPNLVFVICEFGAVQSINTTTSFIELVHSFGCKVCINKFGASFTSFKYLTQLKADFIKIDGSYISNINNINDNQFFVKSLVQIAHGVGIEVIAEFIETAEEFEVCKELAIDGFQGYLIGKSEFVENK